MKILKRRFLSALLIVVAGTFLPTTSQAATPYLNLHISINISPQAAAKVINLTCTPDSKNVPHAKSICRSLLQAGFKSFKPTPKNEACTMIYGGAQTATITGRWGHKVVNAQFSRTNGCEITRWANLSFLLGKF